MNLDTTTKIRLLGQEKELAKIIKMGEIPFLGLYSDFLYEKLETELKSSFNDSFSSLQLFTQCLTRWPAVFSTYLIKHVARGYGESGTHEVYPFIEKALQVLLSQKEKEALWFAFRKVCIELGFPVSSRRSGSNYMVDEYLRQTGVPLKYIDPLVEKMISYSNAAGTPDDDDPSAIRLWQQGLLERLIYLSKPVQKAIGADDHGFYTRLFLRVLDSQEEPDGDAPEYERLFYAAVKNHKSKLPGSGRRKPLSIPQVVWRDNQLGVDLPPGEDAIWKISIGDEHEDHLGFLEGRFVPIEVDLPEKVIISEKNEQISREVTLWEDERNNRLLVFAADGTFVTSGHLGQSNQILLEPGEYQIVTRFAPSGIEEEIETIQDEPSIYGHTVSLQPGEKLVLKRGPAEVALQADAKPLLTWEGNNVRGVRGNELYASNGLRLKVVIPEEMLTDDNEFVLHLKSGNLGEEIELLLSADADGHIHEDLVENLQRWKPGVTRLLAEVRRMDVRRAMVRSSINLWNGLDRIEKRTQFHCSRLPSPDNLLLEESDNLLRDDQRSIITFRNPENRLFRMVFNLGINKKQLFTWSVPGVFLQLKDYAGETAVDKPLRKGSTVSASIRSREVVEIFSTTNGELRLGKFRRQANFDRCGSIRLPLSGLVEHLGPGADTLQFVHEGTGHADDLLTLVAPHQILDFKPTHHSDKCSVVFTTAQEIEEINIRFIDLLTGWEKKIEVHCNQPQIEDDGGFAAWLICDEKSSQGTFKNEIELYMDNWPNGTWVATFDAKMGGRWGRFSNQRNDHYAVGLPVVGNKLHKGSSVSLTYITGLSIYEQFAVLERVHQTLMACFASEAWEGVEWVADIWKSLIDTLKEEEDFCSRAIPLAEIVPDETASDSWIPMISLSAKVPSLYANRGACYRDLQNPNHLLTLKCLSLVGEMKYGVLPQLQEGVIHPMFAFGFSNVIHMAQGDEPKGFDVLRYCEALRQQDLSERLRLLRQDEWQPGEGDYLGVLHFLYAFDHLSSNYMASLSGNEFRRGRALSLCQSITGIPLQGFPAHLMKGPTSVDLLTDKNSEESLPIEQEHILAINNFLSLYARASRWEIRSPGSLDAYLSKIIDQVGGSADLERALCYLHFVGKDLLSFYLLFWEAILKADFDHRETKVYVRKQSTYSA